MDSLRVLIVVLMGLSMIGNVYFGVTSLGRYRRLSEFESSVSTLRIRGVLALGAALFAAVVIVVEVAFG